MPSGTKVCQIWQAGKDSNLQQTVLETAALPIEATSPYQKLAVEGQVRQRESHTQGRVAEHTYTSVALIAQPSAELACRMIMV